MTQPNAPTTLIDRAVLRLSGEDVRGFLQGLVTNDVTALAAGQPVWAALLTPQGKALFDFILWADGDDVLVDCEAAQADALARRLALYRLRRPIAIERTALGVHWAAAGDRGSADPRLPALGRRWIDAPGAAADGCHPHRLALGVAEGVGELGSGETLWLECNAGELGGVSYTKGCYIGQENTARMHHRAKVNRRLVVVPSHMVVETDKPAAAYPALGLSVVRRRVEDIDPATAPDWLRPALG